jgi:multidrug resistance efflux pump
LQELDDSMQRKAAAAEAAEAADCNAQPDQQQQQQAELQQLQASVEACISSFSEVLNTALQRLRRLGLEGFAGAGEESSVLQLVEWLSTSSYNAGVLASRECWGSSMPNRQQLGIQAWKVAASTINDLFPCCSPCTQCECCCLLLSCLFVS